MEAELLTSIVVKVAIQIESQLYQRAASRLHEASLPYRHEDCVIPKQPDMEAYMKAESG